MTIHHFPPAHLLPLPVDPMARSLVVKHEEKPGTSALLNSFLFLALGWMVAGAVLAWLGDSEAAALSTSAGE